MVLADIDQELMGRCLGISHATLRKYYRAELDTAYAIVKSDVVAKFITKARNGDLKAMIFYLETHGWVRSERLVVADGGIDDTDVTTLTDAQLSARIAKLRGAGRARGRPTIRLSDRPALADQSPTPPRGRSTTPLRGPTRG